MLITPHTLVLATAFLFGNVLAIADQQSDSPYVDKNRYLRFTPPAGWEVKEFDDPRSKVEFYVPMETGPNRKASIFVLAHPVATLSPDGKGTIDLRAVSADRVAALQAEGATDARFEIIQFADVEASQIRATLPNTQTRMCAVWFVKHERSFTISLATPSSLHQQYLPVFQRALATFQCIPPAQADKVSKAERDRIRHEQIRVWIEAIKGADLTQVAERRLLEQGDAVVPAVLELYNSGTPAQRTRAGRILALLKGSAAIGIGGVRFSRTRDLQSDGPPTSVGQHVTILKVEGEGVKVRREAESEALWIRRLYVCTLDELRRRTEDDRVPHQVTFIGLADDGSDALYGFVHIDDGRAAFRTGQAVWFNPKYCEAKPDMDWLGLQTRRSEEFVYLIKSDRAYPLPIWPSDRTVPQLTSTTTQAVTKSLEACITGPVPDLMSFGWAGTFEGEHPVAQTEAQAPDGFTAARQLVRHHSFEYKHKRGDYNIWSSLYGLENKTPKGEIPFENAGRNGTTVADLVRSCGPASFTGKFRMKSGVGVEGPTINVYWFGPIFVMADEVDKDYIAIGGWPSRLLGPAALRSKNEDAGPK